MNRSIGLAVNLCAICGAFAAFLKWLQDQQGAL